MTASHPEKETYAPGRAAQAPWPWPFALWAGVATAITPFMRPHLARRAARGKEEPARIEERFGRAAKPRPDGRLIWAHAASVGESLSCLPLIERLARDHHVLVTTATVTAQRLLAERVGGCVHLQYAPLDLPRAAARFFDHWRPDAGILVESELWPNMIRAAWTRDVPMALINGRLSPRSARRWRKAPKTIGRLLSSFHMVHAQSDEDAQRFRGLGVEADSLGNLKFAAARDDERPLKLGRPTWLAASVHPEDASAFADAHRRVRAVIPNALLLLAPRHPDKAREIAQAMALPEGRTEWRSNVNTPSATAEAFMIDRLGELAKWAAAADLAAMGGGFGVRGGHNPIEPARLGAPVVLPPDMAHFESVAEGLAKAGGAVHTHSADAFAAAVADWLSDREGLTIRGAKAAAFAQDQANGVLDRVEAALRDKLGLP